MISYHGYDIPELKDIQNQDRRFTHLDYPQVYINKDGSRYAIGITVKDLTNVCENAKTDGKNPEEEANKFILDKLKV